MLDREQRVSSILVSWKDKIIPIKISDIALFCLEFKTTQLITFDNKKYAVHHNLEELTEICGNQFFRANRQYLINREAVAEASQYFARKLILTLKVEGKHEIIISKTRIQEFLSWLRQ
jgi:DNA-binding LytR/AlgR family response regulator